MRDIVIAEIAPDMILISRPGMGDKLFSFVSRWLVILASEQNGEQNVDTENCSWDCEDVLRVHCFVDFSVINIVNY